MPLYPGSVNNSSFLFFNPTKINCTGTTSLTQLYSVTIPGNTMTANSILRITALLGMTNNTNSKVFRCRIGSTDIFNGGSQLPSKTGVLYQRNLVFRNSLQAQVIAPNDVNSYASFTNAIQEFTFDFTQSQTLSFHVQPSVTTDSMWLDYIYGEVLKL